jgi:hypothetical protein
MGRGRSGLHDSIMTVCTAPCHSFDDHLDVVPKAAGAIVLIRPTLQNALPDASVWADVAPGSIIRSRLPDYTVECSPRVISVRVDDAQDSMVRPRRSEHLFCLTWLWLDWAGRMPALDRVMLWIEFLYHPTPVLPYLPM